MLTVALIGLGAIGQALAAHLAASGDGVRIAGALVAGKTRKRPAGLHLFASIDALLDAQPALVVECARQAALSTHGARVLESGVSVIAASVGALADDAVRDTLTRAATAGGSQLFIPAGALAGIDALTAARHAGLDRVTYTRRAPPETWVKSGVLDAGTARSLRERHVLFEGSARDAALRYPKNANVAATVALAGLGFDATRVTLLADPACDANIHEIEARGAFGRFRTELAAQPLPGATSSAIVAGSLAQAVLSRAQRIAV